MLKLRKILPYALAVVMTLSVMTVHGQETEQIYSYAKSYDTGYADVVEWSPLAAVIALKAVGVESRSEWNRFAVSGGISVGLTAVSTELLKQSTRQTRPDGSDDRSLPSGHSAIVFMGATILHHEYGYISPWVSVGGYTVATAVAASRVVGNRHWAGDVITGAGIGIVATELGYIVGDLIFGDRGLSEMETEPLRDRWCNPSFIAINTSVVMSPTEYDTDCGLISTATGLSTGVEGAYFFNPYVGIGGKGSFIQLPVEIDGVKTNEGLEIFTVQAGVYGSWAFSRRLRLEGNVVGGVARHASFTRRVPIDITIGGRTVGATSVGLTADIALRRSTSLRLQCSYGVMGSCIKKSDYSGLSFDKQLVTFNVGAAISAVL